MSRPKLMEKLEELRSKQKLIDSAWRKTGNKEFLQFLVEILPKTLSCERCSIFILDPVDENVWVQCGTGLSERQVSVPRASSLVGKTISTGHYQIESEMDKQLGAHDTVAIKTGFVTRNALCVPVHGVTKDRVTGAIQVLNKIGGHTFNDQDRIILEKLAFHLQMNIENIFIKQELVKISDEMKEQIVALEEKLKED
ncbi:MAG TPA: GAF domain-containing protein [Gammaproteobacteria bacterium]